jgi:hypothetical protein
MSVVKKNCLTRGVQLVQLSLSLALLLHSTKFVSHFTAARAVTGCFEPQVAQAAEAAAAGVQAQVDTRAVPVRQYLESTVVPTLMQARGPANSTVGLTPTKL